MDLNPIIRLCFQHADGYYSVPHDASLGCVIVPGSGRGYITHAGKEYTFAATDPAATTVTNKLQDDLEAAINGTIVMVTPQDDLSKLIQAAGATGTVDLAPGHYQGSYDFVIPDPGA